MSKELFDMVEEYMTNSDEIITGLQKEASDAHEEIAQLQAKSKLNKEAAIEVAGALVGKGWMSPDNLSQKIDRLCADPLGVIMQMTKTAEQSTIVPRMGGGSKHGRGALSTEKLSNADKALLTKLRLI